MDGGGRALPVHTALPEHTGERRLAERLVAMDDGRLHLWFDLAPQGVANLDIVVWDEETGVFVIEVKAVPIEALLFFDDTDIEIRDRGRSRSPVSQTRLACFDLMDYLRDAGMTAPKMASTVAWPRVTRDEWAAHWDTNSFPDGYELSMLFVDDIRSGMRGFRDRLRWVSEHHLWGSARTSGFRHDGSALQAFDNALRPAARVARAAATASGEEVPAPGPPSVDAAAPQPPGSATGETALRIVRRTRTESGEQPKLWLGTEFVLEAATAALRVLELAEPLLDPGWGATHADRIRTIVARLDEPFRLGVVGEFRAGKSSVVNALVGREVALVAELECTFAPQRFYYAPRPEATIVRRDGRIDRVDVDTVTSMLRDAYVSSTVPAIIRTEVGLPEPILEFLDIWDSPGLGGSDGNAETAQRFADTVDAALWVFDPGYTGQRGLSPTIASLEQRGKAVIGVVNKCDNMTKAEVDRVAEVLTRSYPALRGAALVPFSAELASRPDLSREEAADWAVDSGGNLQGLLAAIRESVLSSPGRVTGRAAAGDLRATLYAVRDEVGAGILDVRRREHLYSTQCQKLEDQLTERISEIGRHLEGGAVSALREHLVALGERSVAAASASVLRDPSQAQGMLNSVPGTTMADFVQGYFTAQRPWIEARLHSVVSSSDSSLSDALTALERPDRPEGLVLAPQSSAVGQAACGTGPQSEAGTSVPSDGAWLTRGIAWGGGTAGVLGTIALLVPGPQWMVVLPAALIAGMAGAIRRSGGELTDADLKAKWRDHWHKQVNEYLADRGLQSEIATAIKGWCGKLHGAVRTDIQTRLEVSAFGSAGRDRELRRSERLEAVRIELEMVIAQLGNPVLGLPPADEMLARRVEIAAGEHERSQELVRRVLGLAREVVAITDGAFSALAMPVLLEAPAGATVRVLAWEQPLSAASPGFRTRLEELRGRRSGSVAVAAPVPVGKSSDALPSGTWVFVPGRAFHFSASLSDTWMATRPIRFEPYEDAGNLYQQHFGRWWDGEVPGYQTLHVQRRHGAGQG